MLSGCIYLGGYLFFEGLRGVLSNRNFALTIFFIQFLVCVFFTDIKYMLAYLFQVMLTYKIIFDYDRCNNKLIATCSEDVSPDGLKSEARRERRAGLQVIRSVSFDESVSYLAYIN